MKRDLQIMGTGAPIMRWTHEELNKTARATKRAQVEKHKRKLIKINRVEQEEVETENDFDES